MTSLSPGDRVRVEALIELQRGRGLTDVHLVKLGEHRFHVAHTDAERAEGTNTEDCPVHEWLSGLSGPPASPGVYVVYEHIPDAYSEPYPASPYDLKLLEPVEDER